jgi:hypothetical protein
MNAIILKRYGKREWIMLRFLHYLSSAVVLLTA